MSQQRRKSHGLVAGCKQMDHRLLGKTIKLGNVSTTFWWSLNYGVFVYIHKSLVTKVERFNDKTESFFVDFDFK